jgi:SAM-dependent methyltransferase
LEFRGLIHLENGLEKTHEGNTMSEQIAKFHADRDAMGHMLYDFYMHPSSDACEIIEREDGYIDVSPVGTYFCPYRDWPVYEQEAMNFAVAGRMLDLGCGAGRVALHFQEHGCTVTAIDNSPLAVEVCQQRGVKDVRLMPVTDVGPTLGLFDTIVMAGNNWGLLSNPKLARWLLRRFYIITSPIARIIAETRDIYQTTDPMHLAYQAWNRERERMSGQIRMRVRHALYASEWFDYLMVSKTEMEQILSGTGWRVREYITPEDNSNYAAVIEKEA